MKKKIAAVVSRKLGKKEPVVMMVLESDDRETPPFSARKALMMGCKMRIVEYCNTFPEFKKASWIIAYVKVNETSAFETSETLSYSDCLKVEG